MTSARRAAPTLRPWHAATAALALALAPAHADRELPAPGRAERVEYHDPDSPPSRGPTHAPVTIEVFFVPGPNLPIAALRVLHQLADRHATRIRVVYRVLKSSSQLLVPSAALEAHAEGKFFDLLDELSRPRATIKKEELIAIARKIGLDPQRTALADQREQYRDVLEANQRRYERLHAGNTPSVVFNAQPVKLALAAASLSDFEREYQVAYGRALDKLERGCAPDELMRSFDDDAMLSTAPTIARVGLPDDDGDRSERGLGHPLAAPPLVVDGMPSFGRAGTAARVPVTVLCRPIDPACSSLLHVVEAEARLFPDDVRLVWAPWFEVTRDDTAELTGLSDAALCAEAIGSSKGELSASPGWVWLRETYTQWRAAPGRRLTGERLLDAVTAKLDVDHRALSACRARTAGASLGFVASARAAGVPRTATALVIGGRIYGGLTDPGQIHQLVEVELAPGVLGSLPHWPAGR